MNLKTGKKLIIAILVLLSFTSFAFADDFAIRDAFTGEIISEDSYQTIIGINPYISYDKSSNMYIYTLTSKNAYDIKANVFDGMIVNYPVSIDAGENIYIDVFKDGEKLSNNNFNNISDHGNYKVFINDELIFSFSIIGEYTGFISDYNIPDDFKITRATFNGYDADFYNNHISFLNEGRYVIEYICKKTGVSYTLITNIDKSNPTLSLLNVKNGAASGPVDISDIEDNTSLEITLNGKKISNREVLRDSGDYSLILTDLAGNVTNYKFTIKPYFHVTIWLIIAATLFICLIILIYAKTSRKRIRVR